MKATIEELFKNHPAENMIHVTSDKTMFFKKNHAESHSSNLEDKSIKTFSRDEVKGEPMGDTSTEDKLPVDEDKDESMGETSTEDKLPVDESESTDDNSNKSIKKSKKAK